MTSSSTIQPNSIEPNTVALFNSKLEQQAIAIKCLQDEMKMKSNEIVTVQKEIEAKFRKEMEDKLKILEAEFHCEMEKEKQWMMREVVASGRYFSLTDRPLDGIIAHLTRTHGGNVVDRGIIEVESIGTNPRNVFDLQDPNSYYLHSGSEEQWLTIDFKTKMILPISYSIQTQSTGGTCKPKTWVLEGSIDVKTWFELDKQDVQEQLMDTSRPFTFTVNNPRLCRVVKFRKTSGCHTGCACLHLAAFELFGALYGL
jgi:hypothetical protein